jgi:hypothetical protein
MKETGTNVGTNQDISPALLSNEGLTVQQAAHNIWEDNFVDTGVDTQDIRDIIIDILLTGKQNYTKSLTKQDEIDELKRQINNLKQDDENKPKFITFEEEQSSGYRNRTIKNASADATIAIAADFNSAGERLTESSVRQQGKSYIPVVLSVETMIQEEAYAEKIVEELNKVKAKTLNIAGNGIYTLKGDFKQTELDEYVYDLLNLIVNSPKLENKIISIRTGGQTGIDEAGAKAGVRLGIPTTILAPKGWTFRNISGTDISNEEQFKARFGKMVDTNISTPIAEVVKPEKKVKKPKKDLSFDSNQVSLFDTPTIIETPAVEKEEVTNEDIVLPGNDDEVGMFKSKFKFGQKKNLPDIPNTDENCK